MFSLRQFASKKLVWLAAVLVPFQSFPSAACYCTMASRTESGLETPPAPRDCCSQDTPGCCAGRLGERRPCRTKTHPAAAKSCCETGGACSCGADNSSPPVPRAPPRSRDYSVNDGTQLSLIALFRPDDDPGSVAFLSTEAPSGASGLARCIVLCRFRL